MNKDITCLILNVSGWRSVLNFLSISKKYDELRHKIINILKTDSIFVNNAMITIYGLIIKATGCDVTNKLEIEGNIKYTYDSSYQLFGYYYHIYTADKLVTWTNKQLVGHDDAMIIFENMKHFDKNDTNDNINDINGVIKALYYDRRTKLMKVKNGIDFEDPYNMIDERNNKKYCVTVRGLLTGAITYDSNLTITGLCDNLFMSNTTV